MIKGVNKNVIEISDTGNDLFERAILFVRPQSAEDDHSIRMLATDFLHGLKLRPRFYSRGLFMGGIQLLSAAIAGGVVAAVLFAVLW